MDQPRNRFQDNSPTPPPRALLFDLDGTLVDSLQDIAESVNHCLELLGLPARSNSSYRYMVGEGIEALCQRAVGDSQPIYVKRLTDLTRAHYRVRCLEQTRPYPGVPAVIQALADDGLRLAVLSNKPHDMTVKIVSRFWPAGPFEIIRGNLDPGLRKPDPRAAQEICRELGVAPAECWIVGDTPVDIRTAINLGAGSVGVTWGFRTRAELAEAGADRMIDHPAELLELPGLWRAIRGAAPAPQK
jgi:phosphoglycolate phosphatase